MSVRFVKLLVLVGVTSLFANTSKAASFTLAKGAGYQIEPIYGYETVFRDYPNDHLTTHMLYGLRLTAGVDLLSVEAEYTKSSDTEDYSTAPEKIKTDDENYKLGITSTYRFNNYFFMSGRAGAQATHETRTETNSGVDSKTDEPMKYNPYAGASVGVKLGPLSLNLNSTVIFKDATNMSKNNYQNTFSVGIGY